jgi:crossover junction endodeoxyribonuclease RuvC
MRVLGIDPGTAITGYGVVEEVAGNLKSLAFGVIRTPAGQPLPARLQLIYQGVKALATEWAPEAAAVEEIFFSSNVRTAMSVGQARGVALLALADAGLDVGESDALAVAICHFHSARLASLSEE